MEHPKQLSDMNEDQLRQALSAMQAELDEVYYEKTVQRLFTPVSGETCSAEELYWNTGVRFSGDRFVLLQLEDDPACPPQPPEAGSDSFPQRYSRLRDILCGALGQACPLVVCNRNGKLLCLVNWQGSEENWHGRLSALVDEANACLHARLGFRLQCVVGRMFTGLEGLSDREAELEKVREYRVLMGGLTGQTLFYDGILRTTGLGRRDEQERDEAALNREFSLSIQHGDMEQAKALFHQMIRRNFVDSKPALQFARLRMYSVIDYLLKTLEKAGRELDLNQEIAALNAAPRLLASESVWQLEKVGETLLDELGCALGGSDQLSSLAFRARSYINDHYQDVNLNVNQVADVLSVTPTHLGRVFKRQFDTGVLSYVHQVRIQEAKRLLNTEATVKEVAQQVGYSSAATLIRAFKRLEGVTPARFGEQAEPELEQKEND
jgi:AraC-like DNA-binding protein